MKEPVILSTEGQESVEVEKVSLLLYLLLYPPYSSTIYQLLLPTFILPFCNTLHDLPHLHHPSMFFPLPYFSPPQFLRDFC